MTPRCQTSRHLRRSSRCRQMSAYARYRHACLAPPERACPFPRRRSIAKHAIYSSPPPRLTRGIGFRGRAGRASRRHIIAMGSAAVIVAPPMRVPIYRARVAARRAPTARDGQACRSRHAPSPSSAECQLLAADATRCRRPYAELRNAEGATEGDEGCRVSSAPRFRRRD